MYTVNYLLMGQFLTVAKHEQVKDLPDEFNLNFELYNQFSNPKKVTSVANI